MLAARLRMVITMLGGAAVAWPGGTRAATGDASDWVSQWQIAR
jgi:hypothetical protein